MKTCTYSQVLAVVASLRSFDSGRLPAEEGRMLLPVFASVLPDLWTREAWPELCDHLESVTLDANACFDLREGDADEMGDILAIIQLGDPRLSTAVQSLGREQWARLEGRVNVVTDQATVWVDWQTPCPDLLAVAAASLDAYTLPLRFKLPLAALGAAHLIANEDPGMAGVLRGVAESELVRQTARLGERPWWRR